MARGSQIAFPQIAAPFTGQPLGFSPAPVANATMVPRHQHRRDRASLPHLWPRVLRIFEQTVGEALLGQGLSSAHHSREEAHAGIYHRDCSRLTAGQHEIAEAQLLDRAGFEKTLV